MAALLLEARKAFASPLFWGGILVAFLGLLYSGATYFAVGAASNADALSVLRYAYGINNSFWFTVVAAAMPFAGSFCEDYRSGELRFQLVREGKGRYLLAKFTVCAVAGGLVVVAACTLFLGLCAALRPELVSLETGEWLELAGYEPFLEFIAEGNFLLYWALFCLSQFFYGAFWAVFGFTVSMFALYRYAAYAAPFIGAIGFMKLMNLRLWPEALNLVSLAYDNSFGGPAQTLGVIVAVYGGLIILMLAICRKRLGTVIEHA